ncbi:MAG: hypothetical protein PHF51_04180 [Candidatus ainarchaeum sp.]|nr:hypothetical protein [Candidatus ainarchaeum sp.]
MAIASDGKTAYVPFELDDALLVVNLSTFAVTDSIDVSAAGSMLVSNAATLTPDGKKLYVSNIGTRNVLAVNTESRRVESVLPLEPLFSVPISISGDGSKAYAPSVDGGLYVINTSDDSYQRIFVGGVIFGPVAPSQSNPDLLYTIGTLIEDEIFHPSFFAFNLSSNEVVRSSRIAGGVMPRGVNVYSLFVNSNETRAYFGWLGMTEGDRDVGNFIVFDLGSFQVSASTPMDNGAAIFTVNEQAGKAYIGGRWVGGGASNELPILEYDLSSNEVARRILMSPSSDQRAIAMDPADPDYLYMTEGDFNLLRKVEISTGREVGRLQFNKAEIRPYAIIRGDGDTGYVVCQSSQKIYKLDLGAGQLMGSIEVPEGFAGWGFHEGRLYVASGRDILSVNTSDGSITVRHDAGTEFTPLIFTFFGDKMAAIDFNGTGMVGRRLLIFNATTMSLLKAIGLPSQPYGHKVIASPDGSKLYVIGGMTGGTATVIILNASTLEITRTIEIPRRSLERDGATSFVEGDFDEANRILYLTGFASVYKIGMDSDELIDTLDPVDFYESNNIRGWTTTGISGAVLAPAKDRLFVVVADSHIMFTYNLANSSWSRKITNLMGYFNTGTSFSRDRRYLYTVNSRSDSITMVNMSSGEVVRIIRLD